jgi:hypothetical protein
MDLSKIKVQSFDESKDFLSKIVNNKIILTNEDFITLINNNNFSKYILIKHVLPIYFNENDKHEIVIPNKNITPILYTIDPHSGNIKDYIKKLNTGEYSTTYNYLFHLLNKNDYKPNEILPLIKFLVNPNLKKVETFYF